MNAGDLIIRTQGLSKTYGDVEALKNLDLEVPQKSIFAFLGPNGAGKTTTIKLLLGLIRPTSGSGTIFGQDIVRDSVDIRARVGYLPQDARFYEHMTARMFALHTFFWITLVLMTGTLFDSATTVIAVPMGRYFILWFGPYLVPALMYISPLLLTFSSAGMVNSLAASFMVGEPVFSWLPLIVTVASCAIFIGVAIWRFNRQEF